MLLKYLNWRNIYLNIFKPRILLVSNTSLGIEVAQSKGVVIFQRKYALDILKETNMIDCRQVNNRVDLNQKLVTKQGESLSYPKR